MMERSRLAGGSRLRRLNPGLALAVCLLVALVVEVSGVAAMVDARLAGLWFAARGERESAHRVVLVAGDAETVERWGPPPWGAARRSAMIDRLAGTAAGVVEAEPGRMFAGGGALVDPPWSAGGVVAVPAERLGEAGDGAVAVNYVGAPERVPTVAAHRVAGGSIPAGFFAGRTVVMGVTDRRYAARWPTPVGWATPGHVVTHALAGRADGVPLSPVPWWGRLLWALGAGALAVWLGGRGRTTRRWLVPLAVGVGVVLVDAAAFAQGGVRVGAATALAAVGAALVINTVRRQRSLRLALAGVRQAAVGSAREGAVEAGQWNRLAETVDTAVGARWTAVLALEGDGRLAVRGTAGVDHERLATWNLHRSAAPFAEVLESGRGVDDAALAGSDDTTRVMVLPLMARGQVMGAWVAALPRGSVVTSDNRPVERLRVMVSRLLDAERSVAVGAADERTEALRAVDALVQRHRLLDAVVEQMGIAALVADPWGRVLRVNAAMRSRLGEVSGEAADRLVRRGAIEVLAALAGWPTERAQRTFAAVFGERHHVELGEGLRLGRIEVVDATGGATVLLLTRGEATQAGRKPGERSRIDVRPLLLKAGRVAAAESQMRIEYEFSDPLPQVECEVGALEQAIASLYTEIRRHSEAGAVTTVSVAAEGDAVGVLLMNASYAVPREVLNALFRTEVLEASGPTEQMHVASQAAMRAGGRLDATSDPISGVVFRLGLPVAGGRSGEER